MTLRRCSLLAADLTLAAALLAPACARKEAPPTPPVEVLVVPVVQRDVPVVGEWIGTLDGSVNADIRPKVEPAHAGEFVIVDVLTGDYEVARDDLTASHRMLARNPGAVMYGIRIGSPAAYRIGGFGTERHA